MKRKTDLLWLRVINSEEKLQSKLYTCEAWRFHKMHSAYSYKERGDAGAETGACNRPSHRKMELIEILKMETSEWAYFVSLDSTTSLLLWLWLLLLRLHFEIRRRKSGKKGRWYSHAKVATLWPLGGHRISKVSFWKNSTTCPLRSRHILYVHIYSS